MYSPNYTHSNHRDNFIPGIDDYDTFSSHILTQNPNQTKVTSSHGNNCSHKKLIILSINCGSIRSQAKRNNLAVLLSEHDIDIVLGYES